MLSFVKDLLAHFATELDTPGRGLVQGSPLSPLLANLYLDALDERIAAKGVKIVRFADDFVILCKSEVGAEKALEKAQQILAEHGLEFHERGTGPANFADGFEFLGHLFLRSLIVKQSPKIPPKIVLPTPEAPVFEPRDIPQKQDNRFSRGPKVMHVVEDGRRIGLKNESFSVTTEAGKQLAAVAHPRVDRIEVRIGTGISENLVEHCMATDTALALIDGYGETRAILSAQEYAKGDLHLAQAKGILDPAFRLALARKLVEARIRNQRTQLFRLNRRPDMPEVRDTLDATQRILRKLESAETVNTLMGHEGAAAALYWPSLALLTKGALQPFRRTRPATDGLNATINYMTAILERDVRVALQQAGLHLSFGLLHETSDRGEAAIYDLMEPFRAPLTEGLAAFLFNANRLKPEMFDIRSDGGVHISAEARRAIIKGYETYVSRRVNAPMRKSKLAWRPLIQAQAYDLAKAFREADLNLFQPYTMEA